MYVALRPDVVRQLENIQLRARAVVEGFLTGLHRSPYHGFSAEFAQHRQYHPGDPLRLIDWKAYARSERLTVKQFQDETNLRANIILDISNSMNFSSPVAKGVTKLQYALDLAAALSFLMIHQRDATGLILCSDIIREILPSRATLSHLKVILSSLEKVKPEGQTALGNVLHRIAETVKRKGLIILLSDLLDDPKEVLKGLSHFRFNGHEVLVFHILDQWERDFEFPKDGIFIDLETGEQIQTRSKQIAPFVKKTVSEFFQSFYREAMNQRIEIVPLTTLEPYDLALLRYLSKREKLS
ncbi:MAG: DUF58 domain-containing protein [bacterium]|nr:DUF58 domain-containing protein [bacterium]